MSQFTLLRDFGRNSFCGCRLEEIDLRIYKDADFTRIDGDIPFCDIPTLRALYLPETNWRNLNLAFQGCNNITFIHIENIDPPMLTSNWAATLPHECVLEVPESSINNYINDKHWGCFKNIQAYESSVNSIKSIMNIATLPGRIINNTQADLIIRDINGNTIYRGNEITINISAGIYVVTSSDYTIKIIVP